MAEHEERQREEIRARHQVQLVSVELEGGALHKLPQSTYGFTYSPTAEEIPAFRKRPYQAFEVHRLHDGSEYLVGFVTAADKDKLEERASEVSLQLYPEPWKDATEIVTVDYARIAKSKRQPSRDDGNYVKIDVAP
jgi:hypothetical protein